MFNHNLYKKDYGLKDCKCTQRLWLNSFKLKRDQNRKFIDSWLVS